MIYRGPGFLALHDLASPPSSVRKLSLFHTLPVNLRSSLLTREGEEPGEKARSSFNHAILSDAPPVTVTIYLDFLGLEPDQACIQFLALNICVKSTRTYHGISFLLLHKQVREQQFSNFHGKRWIIERCPKTRKLKKKNELAFYVLLHILESVVNFLHIRAVINYFILELADTHTAEEETGGFHQSLNLTSRRL
jgi:hypothetical protein